MGLPCSQTARTVCRPLHTHTHRMPSLLPHLPTPGSQVSAPRVGSVLRGCCCPGLGWAVRDAVLTGLLCRAEVSSLRPCTKAQF